VYLDLRGRQRFEHVRPRRRNTVFDGLHGGPACHEASESCSKEKGALRHLLERNGVRRPRQRLRAVGIAGASRFLGPRSPRNVMRCGSARRCRGFMSARGDSERALPS
jgi:hypothetical protein